MIVIIMIVEMIVIRMIVKVFVIRMIVVIVISPCQVSLKTGNHIMSFWYRYSSTKEGLNYDVINGCGQI